MKTTLYRSPEWAYLVESGWSTVEIDQQTDIALMWYEGAPALLAYKMQDAGQGAGDERWALIGEGRL